MENYSLIFSIVPLHLFSHIDTCLKFALLHYTSITFCTSHLKKGYSKSDLFSQ